jgi:hypothetical protein
MVRTGEASNAPLVTLRSGLALFRPPCCLDERPQLFCESVAAELRGRVAFRLQLIPDGADGTAATSFCKLKGAF